MFVFPVISFEIKLKPIGRNLYFILFGFIEIAIWPAAIFVNANNVCFNTILN